ncbi:hypothetical protein S40293_03590 [Stachybotrys chartarum IBT 40293]|nr:hypothetical protein S40293_03590 [Stachybotrys chartarum IBT 40293]KFA72423.1 hypothetical protein S40288_08027 [Stachybotrys chartarum IBT 40288]
MRPALSIFAVLPLISSVAARIRYLGVGIAGIDFGCDIDGSCPLDTVQVPLSEHGGPDGAGQMRHWAEAYDMNMFRLSSTWQYLLNDNLGGRLDEDNFGIFDELMQACLDTGAYCIIDVHNFARYDGGVIAQGGPTDAVFTSLLTQLARFYADNDKVAFGIMNEPHGLEVARWAQTCQAAVTAIREAGATDHLILLPGTNFTNVETFMITGSADALHEITNPDGSRDGLYFDLHKYLDENNSGTHEECTTDNVEAFRNMAEWLREHDRKAIISESGASMDPTCFEMFCAQNTFIARNTDVFEGFIGWGAGAFAEDYIMSLTPESHGDGTFTDNRLMTECIVGPFVDNAEENEEAAESSRSRRPTSTRTTSVSASTSTRASSAETRTTEPETTTTSEAETVETGERVSAEDNDSAAGLLSIEGWTVVVALVAALCLHA